jgi:hypothetical protein
MLNSNCENTVIVYQFFMIGSEILPSIYFLHMYVHIFQMILAASMTWGDTAQFSAIKSNDFLSFLFFLE